MFIAPSPDDLTALTRRTHFLKYPKTSVIPNEQRNA